jgi:apolipoprotein N-acyltransferase
MTAIVDPHGRVVGRLPQFTEGILSGEAQGYTGATPYVRWGNPPIVVACFALVIALVLHRRRALRAAKESR